MSPILVLDTTNAWCACALQSSVGVSERAEELGRGHAERLAPMVREILLQAEIKPTDLTRIGVNTGPGSFAGARVGVSFARGLALSTGAKPVGIGLLPALALQADPDQIQTVMAVHDARRGELIWQIFRNGEAENEPTKSDLETARTAYEQAGQPRLTGLGAQLVDPAQPDFDSKPPLAALLTLTAHAPETAPAPSPIYARPPDAKLPGGIDPSAQ